MKKVALDQNPRVVAYYLWLQLRPQFNSVHKTATEIAKKMDIAAVTVKAWAKDEHWEGEVDEVYERLRAQASALYSKRVFEARQDCLENTLQAASDLREATQKTIEQSTLKGTTNLSVDDLKKFSTVLKTCTDMEVSVLGIRNDAETPPSKAVKKLIDPNLTPKPIDIPADEIESEQAVYW